MQKANLSQRRKEELTEEPERRSIPQINRDMANQILSRIQQVQATLLRNAEEDNPKFFFKNQAIRKIVQDKLKVITGTKNSDLEAPVTDKRAKEIAEKLKIETLMLKNAIFLNLNRNQKKSKNKEEDWFTNFEGRDFIAETASKQSLKSFSSFGPTLSNLKRYRLLIEKKNLQGKSLERINKIKIIIDQIESMSKGFLQILSLRNEKAYHATKRILETDIRGKNSVFSKFSSCDALKKIKLYSDTLIASKDRFNTFRANFSSGRVSLEKEGEIIFEKEQRGYSEEKFGRFFDIAYIPKQKQRKIEGYFIFCEANLFEVPLSEDKPMLVKIFPNEISDEIRKKSKIYPQMKLAPTTDILFVLFPHIDGNNYIQGVGLKNGIHNYLIYPEIPDKVEEDISPHRIAWFDFIGDNPSLILAITEDNHYCLIIYDYQQNKHYLGEFRPLPQIPPEQKMKNGHISSSGPFCLSSNGKFLIAKINRYFDVLYHVRVTGEETGFPELSLDYLHKRKKVRGRKDRSFYHHFKDPLCRNTKLEVAFLAADGAIFRVIGWSVETGSRLQIWGEASLPVGEKSRETEGEIFSNICQAGGGHFYLCDQAGHPISLRIQRIGEN